MFGLQSSFDFNNPAYWNIVLNVFDVVVMICAVIFMFSRMRRVEQSVETVRLLLVHRTWLFQELTSALLDSRLVDKLTHERMQAIHERFEEEKDPSLLGR